MYTLRISRIGQRDIIFSVIQMNPPDHLLHVSGTHAAVKSDRINRINRRRLLARNTDLTTSIRMDDYRIGPVGEGCFDLFYIARK